MWPNQTARIATRMPGTDSMPVGIFQPPNSSASVHRVRQIMQMLVSAAPVRWKAMGWRVAPQATAPRIGSRYDGRFLARFPLYSHFCALPCEARKELCQSLKTESNSQTEIGGHTVANLRFLYLYSLRNFDTALSGVTLGACTCMRVIQRLPRFRQRLPRRPLRPLPGQPLQPPRQRPGLRQSPLPSE